MTNHTLQSAANNERQNPQKKGSHKMSKDLKETLAKTRSYLWVSIGVILVSVSLEMVMMYWIKDIMDAAFLGDTYRVKYYMIRVLVLMLGVIPCLIIGARLSAKYVSHSGKHLKDYYLRQVFKNRQLGQEKVGSLISLMTNQVHMVEDKYFVGRYNLISGFINLIAGLVLVIIVDYRILLVALILGLTLMIGIAVFSGVLSAVMGKLSDKICTYTDKTREILSGMYVIKSHGLEDKVRQDFVDNCQGVHGESARYKAMQVKMNICVQTLVSAVMTGVLLFGTYLVWGQTYGISDIIYILTSFTVVFMPGVTLIMSLPDLKAGKKILLDNEAILVASPSEERRWHYESLQKEIVLDRLSFAYDEKVIFDQVKASFEAGKKYLILGPSGGGKTTLLQLLRMQIGPDAGAIRLDGVSLDAYDSQSYLEHVAYVEQRVFLFEESIKNNISLFKAYPEEDLARVAKKANLSHLIESNEEGMAYMLLDNGKNISGGERVRVAIARAILKEAQILLLDEPYAHLDQATGQDIESVILGLEGMTVFNVSHVVYDQNLDLYDGIFYVDGLKTAMYTPEAYRALRREAS